MTKPSLPHSVDASSNERGGQPSFFCLDARNSGGSGGELGKPAGIGGGWLIPAAVQRKNISKSQLEQSQVHAPMFTVVTRRVIAFGDVGLDHPTVRSHCLAYSQMLVPQNPSGVFERRRQLRMLTDGVRVIDTPLAGLGL